MANSKPGPLDLRPHGVMGNKLCRIIINRIQILPNFSRQDVVRYA
jgi:hypothetical protein